MCIFFIENNVLVKMLTGLGLFKFKRLVDYLNHIHVSHLVFLHGAFYMY